MNTSRIIVRSFKARGLTLSVEASKAVADILSSETDLEGSLSLILDEIRDRIEKREIRNSVIDVETVKSIVADLSSNNDDLTVESTQLIDAYKCPKIEFDDKQKIYKINPQPKFALHGDAYSRAQMYRERLQIAYGRLLRSGSFKLRGINGSQANSDCCELSSIASMLGDRGTHMLLGLLTQPEEGVWHLEDLDATVPLDLSAAQTSKCIISEGCVVLVQGHLSEGKLRVQVMALPPAEDRLTSLAAIGAVDVFGNNARPAQIAQMQQLEQDATDAMFVILSDLQLDRPNVAENFRRVLEGFEGSVSESAGATDPAAAAHSSLVFVLMGSFEGRVTLGSSRASGVALEAALSVLADIICAHEQLAARASFVLVPAAEDAGTGLVLPRRPLPATFTADIRRRVPKVSLASNPCRIRFYTQEIVVFREDLTRKLQRYAHGLPGMGLGSGGTGDVSGVGEGGEDTPEADGPGLSERLVCCLLDQAHLYPLPPAACPVVWELDYTLRLFPLPTLLILAEGHEQFSYFYRNCQVVNPGSFSTDFSFVVYRPASMEVEFSRI